MNKMKKWVTPSFGDDIEEPVGKKKKTEECQRDVNISQEPTTKTIKDKLIIVPKITSGTNTEDWMKNFDPKVVEDLAVHTKKIQEVENWITKAVKGRGEMLLISGPVGSGKTATVQVLADKHNVRIREWITPHDTEIPAEHGKFDIREKQSNLFKKFLVDAGCYSSLLATSNSTVLLVEDYPNTFMKNPSEFTESLQHYRDRRASNPIVFICIECHSENRETALNLFTPALKEQFGIQHISFNSVSATGLKAALKRVSQIISSKFTSVYNTPSSELMECVANSSAGDVRSAVLNLHFASLKGMTTRPSEMNMLTKDSKSKTRRKAASKFQAIGKDESVTLLHGVGRVLNPKLREDKPCRQFTHSPLEIVDQFSSQPAAFVSFLHANYPPHFRCANTAARAALAISRADLLLAEWREKFCQEYGLYTAVAGLMVANRTPVSAWNPVRGPRSMKVNYLTSKDVPLIEPDQLYHGKVLISDYKTYCTIINQAKEKAAS